MITVKNRYNLTDREKEVLKFLIKGYSNPQIAKKLCVSCHTAKAHVCSIIHKMKVNDRVQVIIRAKDEKLV